jgi:Nucleoside 2-deoxyribosyltransferase like
MVLVGSQVFLGGASGSTTWRRKIAIPILEAAGVTYFNPQLGVGEWTEACQEAEMKAKAEADVLLFVVNAETRGVASIAEVAFYLGMRRALALVVTDIGPDAAIDGQPLATEERKDLNRGRIFIRTMAADVGVPVFSDVESAAQHAVELVRANAGRLTVEKMSAILDGVEFRGGSFSVEEIHDGFLIQLRREEADVEGGERELHEGRKWHISPSASESEIVQTAFKAVVTWQEHEARDRQQGGGRTRGAT